jgi:ubiquinone/menaquinone biosynthesis C-methylase UbiE
MTKTPDRWQRWLLNVRFGGDVEQHQQDLAEFYYPVRDKVLGKAQLRPDDTVLDVGAGDGLIAFGALDRLGPDGHVIFSDISQNLLDHCRKVAEAEEVLERCQFLLAPADQLSAVATGSVDVVTTRSVLIYVKDKAGALREFYRVLKPGGRISLFEPINVLMSDGNPDRFDGYDMRPVRGLNAKVLALYESIQPRGRDPIGDFDERDLLRQAEEAGFSTVDLELRVTVENAKRPVPWERYLQTSGNPLVPPLGEALDRTLTADEIITYAEHLRPLVESGAGQKRTALAYLTATK